MALPASWGSSGPAASMYVPQPAGAAAHMGGPSSYVPGMSACPSSSSLLRPGVGGGGGGGGSCSGGIGSSAAPRKDWKISPDMMHQSWGAVLRTLNTNSTHTNSSSGAPGAHGHTHNHTHKGPPGYKTFGEEDDEREPIGRDTMKRQSFEFVAKHAPQQPYSTAR